MVHNEEDARGLVDELKPQPPLPLRAGLKASAYTAAGFCVFWFTRTTGLPEVLAAMVGVAAAFCAGWYDCTLAWKPYQQADLVAADQASIAERSRPQQ
jgi:hypothetical protein